MSLCVHTAETTYGRVRVSYCSFIGWRCDLQRYSWRIDRTAVSREPQRATSFATLLAFLAWLAYLRALRPQATTEERVLRLLIVCVVLLLIVVALVAAGASDEVKDVLLSWPVVP